MYQAIIRKSLIIKLLSLLMFNAYSQSDPQYSHYMYNQMAYNPGYAGSSEDIILNMIGRQQWVGFDGAPRTGNFNITAPFNLFGRSHGVGLSVYNDEIGFNNDVQLHLSYAYKINVGDGNLGIGVNGGLIMWNLEASGDGENGGWNYPTTSTNNGAYPRLNSEQRDNSFDASVGLYYNTDEIFLGLSATHLVGPTSGFDIVPEGDGGDVISGDGLNYYIKPHYYVNAGYIFQLNNPVFEIFPSMLISSDGQSSKLDMNTTLVYNKRFWGGVSYRVGAAITGMAGIELIENLRIGFAYDFGTNNLFEYAPEIYEIFATYSFSLSVEKVPKQYKSIRFL